MARVTEDLLLQPTWSVADDCNLLRERILYATGMASRRYFFVGETHTSSYDKTRNLTVAEWVARTPGVIGIAERALFERTRLGDQLLARTIEHAGNFWREPVREGVGPFADSRNVETAEAIVAAVTRDRQRNPHHHAPVVIFFGQDHEHRIRPYLEQKLTVEDRICWWSMRSIMEYLDPLPVRAENSLAQPVFMGFVRRDALPHQRIELLAKGKMADSFMLTIETDVHVRRHADDVYAVFVESARPDRAAIELALYDSGRASTLLHPPGRGGLPPVVVRPPANEREFTALADALQTRIA